MGLLSRMGRAATALSKYYYPFTWKNKPSIESPINEVHLNHIEDGINEMDNRILILAQDKADATDIANVFVDFEMDDTTGVMTFTRFDGSKVEHDSAVEKIALNCYLEDDNFVLELADGTKQKVSLSKFIDTYEFSSTDTIRITVNGKNISAEIPDGKITLAKLEPTIMSTIRQYTLDAQTAQGVSEQAAGTAQGWAIGGTGFEDNNAKHYASRSQRYAVGGVEEGDTEDNAKYYCQQAQAAAEQATEVAGFDGTASTVSAIDTQGVAVRKASGTGNVTIESAAEHPLLNLDIAGKSEQMVTTGSQLLDLVDMTDISAGGAAISVDSGAYTISGTGTLTGAFSASYRLDYLKSQLKPGNLTLRSDLTIPKMYVRIWDGNTVFAEMQGNSTKQITQDMIDNENVRVECFFHGNAGSTITPGTYHPMLYQSGDGTWEPYTGGKPSPSPEYPQPIISTGTVSTGAQLFDANKLNDYEGVTHTVSNNGEKITIVGNANVNSRCDIRFISSENINEFLGKILYVNGEITNGDSDASITISSFNGTSYKETRIQSGPGTFNVPYIVPDDSTGLTLILKPKNSTAVFEDVMISVDTPTSWEPYTGGKPSPSPEYPQTMDVTVTGAQLLDLGVVEDINAGGATVSIFDGGYTISGTGALTASIEKRYRTDIEKLLKPGNLTLKSTISIPRIYITVRNKSTQLLSLYGNNTGQITQEMLDDENIYIEVMFFGSKDTIITPGTYYPMLYQDGDGTWQPYQSSTVTIPLTEPLRGIGDVRDRIMCRDGVWGVERQFVSLTFDGSENWLKSETNVANKSRFRNVENKSIIKAEETSKIPIKILCDRLKAGCSSDTYRPMECISSSTSGDIYVYLEQFDTGDVDAFKAYLSAHPLNAMFERATPTWEPLPAATQSALNALTTYTGTTHVTITAGGPEPDVGLEYFGQPGDKVTVQDMCDSLAAPGFDDSGVVQGISGFGDFLNRMTSGMRFPSFFRDLKAGLKFVLHTGQLVNNGLCNEPGKYPLDAAYGRTLLEMIGNTANLPGGAADIVSAIVTQNSNLDSKANADTVSGLTADLNNVKESINPLKTSLVGDINNNTVGVVNIVAWDSNTTSTPKSTGNTIYGNGFCLTYSTGNQWLCQLAMAVGDSHLFTRYRRDGVWSGWETK